MTRAERRKNPDYRIAELETELELLRKSNEVQLLELERLREENDRLEEEA